MSDAAQVLRCAKCQKSVMEAGWIPEATRDGLVQSAWLPGPPEPRHFFFRMPWKKDERIPVRAFRCPKCGYIEFYARPA
jgi:hypothetical protein